MNVGSTFSGVGGLDLGLERAGMRVAWHAEIDEWCRRVLRWHWPEATIYDDVRSVTDEAERVDLLAGGFPCQDLSVAGKRAGLAGERSGLFFEFARIADELRPRWLIVENVVGLLSSSHGRDFGIVLSTLAEIGYGVAWRVVDARYFGVPQRRRRVFIIGCLGDDGERAVRALGAGGEGDLATGKCSWQDSAGGVEGGAGRAREVSTEPTAKCLTTSNQRIDAETETFVVEREVTSSFYATGGSQNGFARTDGLAPTLKIGSSFGIASPPAVSFAYGEPAAARCLGQNLSKSLLANAQGGVRTTDLDGGAYVGSRESSVRRLTPTECERLMGWPDGWTAIDGEKTPDSRRYAACGNGVVSNVAEWIGRRIVAVDREAASDA